MRPESAPVYLLRARQRNLRAESLAELAELIECAHNSGDHIELLVAYYPTGRRLMTSQMEDLLDALQGQD